MSLHAGQRLVRVTTAAQAAARDADAIASGIDEWSLMLAAGTQAASTIVRRYSVGLRNGAIVFAGSGNNGGDAYVVAARLLQAGVMVTLHVVGEPRTAGCQRASRFMQDALNSVARDSGENINKLTSVARDSAEHTNAARAGAELHAQAADKSVVVVDGVLGTGQQGELREAERNACIEINKLAANSAVVVALDVPTGVNATTGEISTHAVRAHHSIAFGTLKRAHLLQRAQVGAVTVVDIGLGVFAEKSDDAWTFADCGLVAALVPPVLWNAHKGTRGRLAIVGGAKGMAGAVVLAARAALRAGAGLVYTHSAPESALALQIAVPQAVSRNWPSQQTAHAETPDHVQAAVIGPGLGRTAASVRVLAQMLHATRDVPLLLDADALTLLATNRDDRDDGLDESLTELPNGAIAVERVRQIGATRPVVCTPHVGEFARLINHPAAETLAGRITQAMAFASAAAVVVLLKGTPTMIITPDGAPPTAVATGTSALATGGSGDLLSGIVGALLVQGLSTRDAAIAGAWVHGRAAEIATDAVGCVRGMTLDEVLLALPAAWRELSTPPANPPDVLAQVPAVWT